MNILNPFFLKKLVKTIMDSNLLVWGDRVMIAVSGGVDSTVLLLSLYELRHYLGIDIACASFDHKIRTSSDKDIAFVAGLCKQLSIPFYSGGENVKSYAKNNRLNTEEAARILRYRFLMESAVDFGAKKLAVAHHLDDFAENFIIRLITGSGSGAMAGIAVISGIVIRPFINHTKREILDFAEKNSIKFREDYTNYDKRILRNFVRLEIIPLLKERNVSFLKTIRNTSEILRKDDDFIEKTAFKLFKEIATPDTFQKRIIFDANALIGVDEPVLYRFLRAAVLSTDEKYCESNLYIFSKKIIVSYANFKVFLKLIKSKKPNTYFFINSFICVRKEYNKVAIEYMPLSCRNLTFKSFNFELKLSKDASMTNCNYNYLIDGKTPGTIKIDEIGKTFYIKELDGKTGKRVKLNILRKRFDFASPDVVYFDYDKIVFPVTIRPFKEGDRFVPLGIIAGHKKIKEYFIDKKVPLRIRKIIPLVIFGDEIAWVSLNTLSNNIKITEFTNVVGVMGIK
ncbi:tRNA lysidine(34) synthetase TilS [Candidatus Acidulodesulfobacterium sp. H_13]|uniref:tRNA lysidine(34) synthetase TilS n=1 Tax=Candidatus Acidulodesulfobacterium sp. H_13 TaxID=3395470 RepID=UPI003AF8119E